MENMPKPAGPQIHRRKNSGQHRFRRRIPADSTAHYPEHTNGFVSEPLPTSDIREAGRLVVRRWADLDDEWERVRRTGSRIRSQLDDSAIAAIVARWMSRELERDELERPRHDGATHAAVSDELPQVASAAIQLYARRAPLPPTAVSAILETEGLTLDPDSPDGVRPGQALARAA